MDAILKEMLDRYEEGVKVIRSGYLIAESGRPQAKQSTRFGGGRAFTSKKKADYLKMLAREFKSSHGDSVILTGMVRLTVLYCFPWTKADGAMRQLGWALTSVGVDLDNMLKPVKDAMQKLIVNNDSQVVDVRARKIRYDRGVIVAKIDEVMPNRDMRLISEHP